MKAAIEDSILAVVTTKANEGKVSGAVAVFLGENEEAVQHLCLLLSRILKGMSHDLENGVYLIVKH